MEKMQTLKGEYKNMHKGNIIMQRRENTIKPQNVKHKQQKTDIKSLNTSREKENTNTNRRNTPNHDKIHEMKMLKHNANCQVTVTLTEWANNRHDARYILSKTQKMLKYSKTLFQNAMK